MTREPDPHAHLGPTLSRRLTALAERAPHDVPDVALDLARGRRGVRRRRTAVAAGAVGAVAAASALLALLPGSGLPGADPVTGPAGQGSATPPSTAVDDTVASATERDLAPGESLVVTTSADALAQAAEGYGRVVAELLDPTGVHAVLPTGNVQSSGDLGDLSRLGTTVGWRVPGEEGRGAVSVVVGRSWASADWSCTEPGWTCSELPSTDDVPDARTASYDGGLGVSVRRADGAVVTLSTATLDARSSRVPVDAVGLTVDDLLDAASDARFALPAPRGEDDGALAVPSIEERLAGDATVLAVGREVLLPTSADETARRLAGGRSGDQYQFGHTWRWTGPDGRGTVTWSVDASPSVRRSGTCTRAYERCVVRTERGREVFVGWRRDGRGWSVWAPGPVRTMQVSFTGAGLPVERALALVLDPRLQRRP